MGPFRHIRRGITAAYQNIGISIVFCLISFFAASASVGFILPLTESWGALFMAAVLAGKKADWNTFQAVLNRRTIDILVFGLISFVIFGLIGSLIAFLFLSLVIGVPLVLGMSLATETTEPMLDSMGTAVGFGILGGLFLLFLALLLIALYCFLRLLFTPYVLHRTDRSFNDAIKTSWRRTREYGVLRILFTLLFAWIAGSVGLVLCGIGALLTWPVVYGTVGSLFQDAFGERELDPRSSGWDEDNVPESPDAT